MLAFSTDARRSFLFTQQLQREWDRRQRADGDQRPADRSPLFRAQLLRQQQRDAGAKHCTRAGDETNLRNGDFVLFHLLLYTPLIVTLNPLQGSGVTVTAGSTWHRVRWFVPPFFRWPLHPT